MGRGFQKNPGLVFAWADELGVQVQMPNQVCTSLVNLGLIDRSTLTMTQTDPLGLRWPLSKIDREVYLRGSETHGLD